MIATAREPARSAGEALERERLLALVALASEFATAFQPREALRAAAEALQLARGLKDAASEARLLAIATLCHYQRGDYVSAVATGLDACATFAGNDLAGRSQALHSVALAFFTVDEFRRAEAAARRAILYAGIDGEPTNEAAARNVLGYILADGGDFDAALVEFRRARTRFRTLGDTVRVKKTASNAGHAWRKRGISLAASNPEEARRSWRRAMRFYRSALAIGRARLDDAIILGSLGECAFRLGHPEEALAHLHAAQGRVGPRDAARIRAHLDLWRGQSERVLGRTALAERHLKAALACADSLENDTLPFDTREALAALADDRGEGTQARAWRDEVRKLREERRAALADFRREMRPLWDRFLREE